MTEPNDHGLSTLVEALKGLRRDIGQVRGLLSRGPMTEEKHHQQTMLLSWEVRLVNALDELDTLLQTAGQEKD